MYSIILAAALASSPATPSWHPHVVVYVGSYPSYRDYRWYGYGFWNTVPVIQVAASAPARVVVSLPADAKLFVQDQQMTGRSTERTFITPALETGYTYTYTLRAEVIRDGQKLTETKTVSVRARHTSRVSFTESEMVLANDGPGASAGR